MAGKQVVLGVTGGIAAYKSAELLRLLVRDGAHVQVVLTRAAAQFVGPRTYQALSGRRVAMETDAVSVEPGGMDHIALAHWADVVLVAPATADFMARLAHGLAGDLLSSLCLALEKPLALAPAMNRAMWEHPATRANLALLRERGAAVFGPEDGAQACGDQGPGRMLEVAELRRCLESLFHTGVLRSVPVLVSAGPTREALDPVRYLGNYSSGRMGYAVAGAALEAGAQVTLISGPVSLETPAGARCVSVRSAAEMRDAVLAVAPVHRIFFSVAAVSDYRCDTPAPRKIRKEEHEVLQLRLIRNPDILAEVSGIPEAPFTVGFAAETEGLLEHARAKLLAKGLDLIVANPVGGAEYGFGRRHGDLTLLWEGGSLVLGRDRKELMARRLVREVARRYLERETADAAPAH